MTSLQTGKIKNASYGFGWGISKNGFGHGGANKNDMEIDTKTGRIFIFMVQQDGPWGTPAGDAMTGKLQKLADDLVAHSAQ
jgi:hypothetical protein